MKFDGYAIMFAEHSHQNSQQALAFADTPWMLAHQAQILERDGDDHLAHELRRLVDGIAGVSDAT